MSSRLRFLITVAFVCHLLLAPRLVTSQLLSAKEQAETKPAQPPSAAGGENVTISALEQEKDGPIFKLRGQVEIHYLNYILRADQITYNSETGDITAEGHFVLEGGLNDERVHAARGTYNLHTEIGKFEDVTGTIGVQLRGAQFVLTSTNPFTFTGKTVEKTGPDHYVVHDGTVTTCKVPHPKWEFRAQKVAVDVSGDATIHNTTFLVEGIPVFYLPFATHPVQPQRRSGFLIPNLGTSSRKGLIVGQSVYWAINRSMDATLGAEYYSMRGWAPQGGFRARPSETSFMDLSFLAVLDRGFGPNHDDQGGANVRLNAEAMLPHDIRAVTNIDYLTSFVFRLAFNEVFTQAVYSEVKSQAFLSKTKDGFFYNTQAARYQNFESTTTGDVVTILHVPGVAMSSVDRRIGSLPLYWSFDASAGGLSRSEPAFRTGQLVGRFDLAPTISLPLVYRGWSFRPEVAVRDTFYTQELEPSDGIGVAADNSINRRAFEGAFELRPPALDRVFAGEFLGRKWKHVIEPEVTYRYVTGVNNFDHILRFDDRDILSNTNEIEYRIVNRLYSKRAAPARDDCDGTGAMPSSILLGAETPQGRVPWTDTDSQPAPCTPEPDVREVVTWELAQKYFMDPSFGGALVPGRRNVFTTTADLTGIAFLTEQRQMSPLVSRLRVQTSHRSDVEWDLDYDFKTGRINSSAALVNYRVGAFTLGGGDAYLRTPGEIVASDVAPPPQRFNQFRALIGYGYPNKRGFSGAANVGFDAEANFLQYAAVQTTYNWDCCGVSAEYRRFNLGTVRNENQFRFTFALANIGAFGNLARHERLF